MEKKFTVVVNYQDATDDYVVVLKSWILEDGQRTNEVSLSMVVADFDAAIAAQTNFKEGN